MGKCKLLIIAAVTMAMSIGLAGMAFAATPTANCGWCHGVYTPAASGTGVTDKRDGVQLPGYEDVNTPQTDNIPGNMGRGLHGIHMNYSSASYGLASGSTTRGNCAQCHAGNIHENGYVEFSGMSANARQKTSAVGLKSNVTVTGTGISASGLDITNMNGTATCSNACHKGTSAGNPAPWGNYTTTAIKLTCNSCHADLAGGVAGSESALSGKHGTHLASSATVPNGSPMNSANNAGCANCHPSVTGEGKSTKDWGQRLGFAAYPHASDGTNVVADNANLTFSITTSTKAGTNTTCATRCHPRSKQVGTVWGGALDCNMCHYYTGGTDTGFGALPGAHEIHITLASPAIPCSSCHPIPGDATHATVLPTSYAGTTLVAGLGYSQSSANVATGNSGTCTNSCHIGGSTAWSNTTITSGCAACHEYPGAGAATSSGNPVTANVDWASTNGHSTRATLDQATNPTAVGALSHLNVATVYNKLTDNYSTVSNSQTKCGKCHSGPKSNHMNGTNNVAPGTGAAAGFTQTNHTNGSSDQCANVKCHFGRTSPNWY